MENTEKPKQISQRQIDIINLAIRGLKTEAIAVELKISVNTVKYHKKKIFMILGTSSIAETIGKFVEYNVKIVTTQKDS